MNPADNLENWAQKPLSDAEKDTSHTIDCPFYSVVPASSGGDGGGDREQQLDLVDELIPDALLMDSVSDSSVVADSQQTEDGSIKYVSVKDVYRKDIREPLNAASLLESELEKIPAFNELDSELDSELDNFSDNNLSGINQPSAVKVVTAIDSPSVNDQKIEIIENTNLEETNSVETNLEAPQEQEINAEFNQLLNLNQELRVANDDLYKQVEKFTEALQESQTALQKQKKRADVTESLLAQQNKELSAAQSQIESLFQQLETSQNNVQRQETLLETYRANLETNQQKLAQLERECANLQSTYNEQSQQLAHSEAACRELRTRLMRQQRQTLQFKAALEKCLESPLPNVDNRSGDFGATSSSCYEDARNLLNNNQRIQPWSADTQEDEHISIFSKSPFQTSSQSSTSQSVTAVPPWQPPTATPDISTENISDREHTSNQEKTTNENEDIQNPVDQLQPEIQTEIQPELETEDNNTQNNAQNIQNNQNDQNNISAINAIVPSNPPTEKTTEKTTENPEPIDLDSISTKSFTSLEAQIDSVIQMFFTASGTTSSGDTDANSLDPTLVPQETKTENPDLNPNTPVAEGEFDVRSPWDTTAETNFNEEIDTITIDIHGNITDGIDRINQQQTTAEQSNKDEKLEAEDFWGDVSKLTPEQISILNSPAISDIDDGNSPSPVVYPNRPPKGRKSMSSVELPNFRPPQK